MLSLPIQYVLALLDSFLRHGWAGVHVVETRRGHSRNSGRVPGWGGHTMTNRKRGPGLGGQGHGRKCPSLTLLNLPLHSLQNETQCPPKWSHKGFWRSLHIQPHYFNGSKSGKVIWKKASDALNRWEKRHGRQTTLHTVTQRHVFKQWKKLQNPGGWIQTGKKRSLGYTQRKDTPLPPSVSLSLEEKESHCEEREGGSRWEGKQENKEKWKEEKGAEKKQARQLVYLELGTQQYIRPLCSSRSEFEAKSPRLPLFMQKMGLWVMESAGRPVRVLKGHTCVWLHAHVRARSRPFVSRCYLSKEKINHQTISVSSFTAAFLLNYKFNVQSPNMVSFI